MDDAIELADFIADLRGELERAIWRGEGKDLGFELGPIELELAVVAERETKPGGKIKLWVLEGGAEARRRSMVTHTVRLTLEPRLLSQPGEKVKVSGNDVPRER
ncbi:hypothetical protein ACTI_64370 [Actinoplanes sp. OR16]|uniref:trypco2 family protein n=1 Tax=Actinoplanes sp. OR16 TaxID=946334 RepID=UPI000F71D56F|nr:trypco2 family protein [Actinoplanes sp. OR16]BBH69752.1 hypothetical protein ACTI_64370 [Actinoplanes sp. OR16]